MPSSEECCGGDPPCWAHLFEDADGVSPVVDLASIAAEENSHGPAWTLQSEDLNVNLLVFNAGEGVDEHRNGEVDVLLAGVSGEGSVFVDGVVHSIGSGQLLLISKGALRSTRAVSERFSYLTCHRRRSGLQPTIGKLD